DVLDETRVVAGAAQVCGERGLGCTHPAILPEIRGSPSTPCGSRGREGPRWPVAPVGWAEAGAGPGDHETVLAHRDVELEQGQLGQRIREHREPPDDVLERRDVERGRTAVAKEARRSAHGADETCHVSGRQGSDAVRDVTEELARVASDPKAHDRAEEPVLARAQDARDAVVTSGPRPGQADRPEQLG